MAENSAIEWTDHTFNPWVGCQKISPACDHCYAENWAKRTGGAALWQGERRRTSAANWRLPFKWNRDAEREGLRRKVFCASLADVFDNQVPDEWRQDLFEIIRVTLHLDWQLLTKRPQNIVKMLPADWGAGWPNVWLGTTVANQDEADRNVPHLLAVPAARRFLSIEPMIGPVSFRWARWVDYSARMKRDGRAGHLDGLDGIDWVICGGESGAGARPMHPDWARSLRDQCQEACVPFFFKQWGEWLPGAQYQEAHRARDSGDYSKFDCKDWENGIAVETNDYEELSGDEVFRVGRKAAGALLDGREWRETPEVPVTGGAA